MLRGGLSVLVALLFAVPASAQVPTPTPTPTPTASPAPAPAEKRIAPGVSAAGVDVSNLTLEEAATKLAPLGDRLRKNVQVSVAGKQFSMTVKQIGFVFDPAKTARRAYNAGREANGRPVDVPLFITFRKAGVQAFAGSVDRAVYVAPVNATVRITLKRIIKRRAKLGRDLDAAALTTAIQAVLIDPLAKRVIKPGRKVARPAINANDLARVYRTVVTIDRANFKLRLFKNLRLSKTYGVAVGAPGYPTPTGSFRISNKAVNPVWNAPNKPWAGEFAGQSISGGSASNPLKARWLGIANGVGIHGTGAEYSIGTRASHGCIRMRVADVIDLYPRVPVGTPVLIR